MKVYMKDLYSIMQYSLENKLGTTLNRQKNFKTLVIWYDHILSSSNSDYDTLEVVLETFHNLSNKALQNWKISVKASLKQLWKLTIKTKRL